MAGQKTAEYIYKFSLKTFTPISKTISSLSEVGYIKKKCKGRDLAENLNQTYHIKPIILAENSYKDGLMEGLPVFPISKPCILLIFVVTPNCTL